MRLTILNQFYPPELAATAHLAASLAEHRAQLGDEVQVIASQGGYVSSQTEAAAEQLENLRVRRLWTPRLGKRNHLCRLIDYASFYLAAAWCLLFCRRQDVIITLTTPPLIGLTAVLHKLIHWRTKIILWNMDCYPDVMEGAGMSSSRSWVSRILRWLKRIEFRHLDHLVTLDQAMSDLLLPQYAPPGRELPTTVIPNWERAELFPANPQPQAWPLAETRGLDGRFVILYLGNTGYGHCFDAVIEAAQQLREEPVTFLFVGGGRRWQELEQAQQRYQLENLLLHGYVPKEETPAVMQLADCALITLHDWSLGVMSPSKLHSNLAMSLPVIYVGPAGSNVDQAITDYQCGISLRASDAAGLVAFVRKCLADRQHLQGLQRQARTAFERSYCDRQTLPQFDAVLEQVQGK